jgi:SAM-dependent methyltransferase
MTTPSADVFDRNRRAMRRARYSQTTGWFDEIIAEQLVERLDDVKRRFGRALVIGGRNRAIITAIQARCDAVDVIEPSTAIADRSGAMIAEEDQLAVEPESYDLVVWPGGLESVNDVPGALLRARWALKPDGLLIGCLFGDGSFPALRRALQAADAPQAIARMHPQLSLATLGDLLSKAGLALIVTDAERLTVSYARLDALVRDLRHNALTNVLSGRPHPLHRSHWSRATAAWLKDAAPGQDGQLRSSETIRLLHFSGWAPDASQPQPARRGSATMSLATALKGDPKP